MVSPRATHGQVFNNLTPVQLPYKLKKCQSYGSKTPFNTKMTDTFPGQVAHGRQHPYSVYSSLGPAVPLPFPAGKSVHHFCVGSQFCFDTVNVCTPYCLFRARPARWLCYRSICFGWDDEARRRGRRARRRRAPMAAHGAHGDRARTHHNDQRMQ